MVQYSEKPKKITFFHFSLLFFFCAENKIKMLSSQFSNIRRTPFNQSSPVQPVSEIRTSQKISKNHFSYYFFVFSPSSKFSNIRRTGFDQSSPVHPVSDFRGGSLSVTDGQRTKDEVRKSSCLIQDQTTAVQPENFHNLQIISYFQSCLSR